MSLKALQLGQRALSIKRNLGTRSAAGYLRNRNVTLDEALFILVGRVRP